MLVAAILIFRDRAEAILAQVYARFSPCSQPVSYKLGIVDADFGISDAKALAAVKAAEAIWEKGTQKDLFKYDQDKGAVTISFVYDYRQRAIDKLKSLGYQIDNNQTSYDSLKSKYDSMQAEYNYQKPRLESDVALYRERQDTYNREVQQWNGRGGAPKDVYQQLQNERSALETLQAQIQQEQNSLNSLVDAINALATTLNSLAKSLNLDVKNYNQVGESTGGEFEEGVYVSSLGLQKIDIYEFSSQDELIRVLAHELGHALGLEHVDDKDAIMYKLNQSSNDKVTLADYKEFKRVCHVK